MFRFPLASLLLVAGISFSPVCARAGMRSPADKHYDSESPSGTSAFITFYQKFISPVDGQRCQMYPSCSHYATESIGHYGAVKGFLMGTDRIMRCGLDLRYYPRIYVNQRNLYLDLPEDRNPAGGK